MTQAKQRLWVGTLAALSLFACVEPLGEAGSGRLALQIDVDPAALSALDAVRVRVLGPTPRDTTVMMPGGTVSIQGLVRGRYSVSLEGLVAGAVTNYVLVGPLDVVPGQVTQASVSNFFSFVVANMDVPSSTVSRTFTVSYNLLTHAQSYRVEAATDAAFTQNYVFATPAGGQGSATITVPTDGTYSVRARGVNPHGVAGQWNALDYVLVIGPVDGANSTISASPTPITASSGASVSTITVTARDALGSLVPGATVVLAAAGSGNVVTQPAGPTDASGRASGYLSSTITGTKTVSATIGGTAVVQTATVTVTPDGPSAANSTVTAAPSTITASNGASVSTITVTARDQFSNAIPGAAVVLGATGTANTLTQPAPTNSSGQATGTLSSTSAGTKTVSATINGTTAVTQTAAVTVTNVDLVISSPVALTVTPATIAPGGRILVPQFTVTNQGTTGSNSYRFGAYQSVDQTITTADSLIFSTTGIGLAPGASATWNGFFHTMPSGAAPGSYFVGYLVDDLNSNLESNEGNNFKSAAFTVLAPDQANEAPKFNSRNCGIGGVSNFQGFTPTRSSLLAVELSMLSNAGGNTTMNIRSGSPAGAILGSASATVPASQPSVRVLFQFATPITLVPGNLYIIEWPGQTGTFWDFTSNNEYSGGNASCSNQEPTVDYKFRTF